MFTNVYWTVKYLPKYWHQKYITNVGNKTPDIEQKYFYKQNKAMDNSFLGQQVTRTGYSSLVLVELNYSK